MASSRKSRTLSERDEALKPFARQLEDEYPGGDRPRPGDIRRARAEELLRRLGGGGPLAEFLGSLKGSEFRAVVEFLNILENANHVVVSNRESKHEREPGAGGADLKGATLPSGPVEAIEAIEAIEAEHALRRAAELIDINPSIIERLLPEIGRLMERVEESPNILGVDEAMVATGLGKARIQQLPTAAGVGRRIGGRLWFGRRELLRYVQDRNPPGRPPKSPE